MITEIDSCIIGGGEKLTALLGKNKVTNNDDGDNHPPRIQKHKCGNCKEVGYHEDDDCFKLEKNKSKRPAWYKRKYGDE